MNRTQLYLDPAQQKMLRAMADERSTTISQLVREAIGEIIARYRKQEAKSPAGIEGIIGVCRIEQDVDGSANHDDIYD